MWNREGYSQIPMNDLGGGSHPPASSAAVQQPGGTPMRQPLLNNGGERVDPPMGSQPQHAYYPILPDRQPQYSYAQASAPSPPAVSNQQNYRLLPNGGGPAAQQNAPPQIVVEKTWSCSACTLENAPLDTRCGICNTERGASGPGAAVAPAQQRQPPRPVQQPPPRLYNPNGPQIQNGVRRVPAQQQNVQNGQQQNNNGRQQNNNNLRVSNAEQRPFRDWFWCSCVTMTCCFLPAFPCALIAMMNAVKARSARAYGDGVNARKFAKKAKRLIIAGILFAIVARVLVWHVFTQVNANGHHHGHHGWRHGHHGNDDAGMPDDAILPPSPDTDPGFGADGNPDMPIDIVPQPGDDTPGSHTGGRHHGGRRHHSGGGRHGGHHGGRHGGQGQQRGEHHEQHGGQRGDEGKQGGEGPQRGGHGRRRGPPPPPPDMPILPPFDDGNPPPGHPPSGEDKPEPEPQHPVDPIDVIETAPAVFPGELEPVEPAQPVIDPAQPVHHQNGGRHHHNNQNGRNSQGRGGRHQNGGHNDRPAHGGGHSARLPDNVVVDPIPDDLPLYRGGNEDPNGPAVSHMRIEKEEKHAALLQMSAGQTKELHEIMQNRDLPAVIDEKPIFNRPRFSAPYPGDDKPRAPMVKRGSAKLEHRVVPGERRHKFEPEQVSRPKPVVPQPNRGKLLNVVRKGKRVEA